MVELGLQITVSLLINLQIIFVVIGDDHFVYKIAEKSDLQSKIQRYSVDLHRIWRKAQNFQLLL